MKKLKTKEKPEICRASITFYDFSGNNVRSYYTGMTFGRHLDVDEEFLKQIFNRGIEFLRKEAKYD